MANFTDNYKKNSSKDNIGDNMDFDLKISNDYYEAYLSLDFKDDSIAFSKDDLLSLIEKKHISYGINNDLIEEIINNKKSVEKILIAEGKRHKNGEDGKIVYNFDMNYSPRPTLLEDGRVDHKSLNIIHKVKKGEILASRVLPTTGEDGISVTGKTIKAKPGKLVNLKAGKNVKLSNDNNYLIANQNGFIKIIDERICVIPILEINSDVGISTGNIHFNGKIVIKGNVEKGYTIQSEDDIEIYGIVEGAKIKSIGSILIHKGASNGANLISDNNITVKFMESCIAKSGKNFISEAVLHSDIECKQDLIVDKGKGLIVGGNISVRKNITAKTIGSHIGTLTKIQLGIDDELLSDYKNTKDKINQLKSNISKLDQAISILKPQTKLKPNDSNLRNMLEKSFATKKQYLEQLDFHEKNLITISETIDELKKSKISSDIIYPGVKIKINNAYYNTRNTLQNVTLVKDEGDVRILPKV